MNGGRDPVNANRPDDILHALSHHTRRDVIDLLISHPEETITVDELAEDIMARRDEEAYDDRHRVEMVLRHIHVPKLADYRFVEYNPREGRVRYGGDAELETFLDDVQELETG